LLLKERTLLSLLIATEQDLVEVSIFKIIGTTL
jgi:hypothetical protein